MNCQICLEHYNIANRIPKNLSCGHTFCERCIKKLAPGHEIECPKCRHKSKNNLPTSYGIYDHLVLESKSETDESCMLHEYENLQFYCNKDKINICALCLTSTHQGHVVSLIKDKIIADENEAIINKWNTYFNFSKEEYYNKKEKLTKIMNELVCQKHKLTSEISVNYDKLIDNFNKIKNELWREVEELYSNESLQLSEIKNKVEVAIKSMGNYLCKTEKIVEQLPILSNNSILSINIQEFKREDEKFNEIIEGLDNDKTKIKFKTIKWSDDVIFSKKETSLNLLINEENKLKNHIVLFGDYKDRIIVLYDINNKQWTRLDSSFGVNFELLDCSCVINFKSDLLLITGGCQYSNYRSTASRNTYIAKIVNREQITFTEFKSLLSERFSHGSCVVRGVPYVFGGHNGVTTLNSVEYFDEKEMVWKGSQSSMIIEREIFGHCVVKDRYIYVFGGFNDTHLDSIEKFDSVHNRWRILNVKMRKPLQNATAVSISDDQIALVGGYNGGMYKSIDLLNLTSLTWTGLEKMKVPRRKSHCFFFEDKILIIGGEGTEVDAHIPELFDIKTFTTSFVDPSALIVSKSMNFWCSTMIV